MSFTIPTARLEFLLQEDSPYGDLTTQGLGIGELHGRLSMTAGALMTVCCAEEAETLFRLAGCDE
ncbi:ModD protein, partial [Roseomonas sp. DSM 102946]|nr:ModD protein [Roseomonas sp. DSM 102946]